MFSKFHHPLGVESFKGRQAVLYPPYQTAEPESCGICHEPLPAGRYFVELKGCSHAFCYAHIMYYFERIANEKGKQVSWECPLCRNNVHQKCRMVLDGNIALPPVLKGFDEIYCHYFEDVFGNFHVVLFELIKDGGVQIGFPLCYKTKRNQPVKLLNAYVLDIFTGISPFTGRHLNVRPNQNPILVKMGLVVG